MSVLFVYYARENRQVLSLDLKISSELLFVTVLGGVPGSWSETAESTFGKCCPSEWFGQLSGLDN